MADGFSCVSIIDSGQFSSCDIEQEADIEKYQKRMRELIESIDCWRFAHSGASSKSERETLES